MGLFEDGFLNLHINRDSPATKAIDLSVQIIVLMVQIIIGIAALTKMGRKHDINKMLTFLFLLSLFCASIYTVIECFQDVHWSDAIFFIQTESFGCFYQTLLATLIIRLYITFKGSAFGMSSILILVFSVIMVLGSVGWIVFSALFVYTGLDHDKLYFLAYFCVFLYVVGGNLAVYFFVSNLMEIAKLRETTMRDPSIDEKDIELNIQQQGLSDLSAKYIMLFALAIVSTFLLNILALFVNEDSGLRSLFCAADLAVNILMLYLQFVFGRRKTMKYEEQC